MDGRRFVTPFDYEGAAHAGAEASVEPVYLLLLQSLWSAGRQSVDATEALCTVVADPRLREGLGVVARQVAAAGSRLAGVIDRLGADPTGERSPGMAALADAAFAHATDFPRREAARDAAAVALQLRMTRSLACMSAAAALAARHLGREAEAEMLADQRDALYRADASLREIAALGPVRLTA